MRKICSFTLLETLIVVTLLAGLAMAMLFIYTDTNLTKAKYDNAKDELKSFLMYNKYKSLNDQTIINVVVNTEKNLISSVLNDQLEWLTEFTNIINIKYSSTTNISFDVDGHADEFFIDIESKDGIYTNRLIYNSLGVLKYQQPRPELDMGLSEIISNDW